MSDKNKNELIKFALEELQKTVEDIKNGKTPTTSRKLKKMLHTLNEGYTMIKNHKITEEDMNAIVDETIRDLNKKEE